MHKTFIDLATIAISLFAVCGAFEIQPRIANGFDSEPGQFPYYVFIELAQIDANGTLKYGFCGGAIIR